MSMLMSMLMSILMDWRLFGFSMSRIARFEPEGVPVKPGKKKGEPTGGSNKSIIIIVIINHSSINQSSLLPRSVDP